MFLLTLLYNYICSTEYLYYTNHCGFNIYLLELLFTAFLVDSFNGITYYQTSICLL